MGRRKRRGGANCTRALNAKKALKAESSGLAGGAFQMVGQNHPQEERREEPCTNWHFKSRPDNENGLRRKRRTWKTRPGVKNDKEPQKKTKSHLRSIRFSNIENVTLVSKLMPVYEQLLGTCKSRTPFVKKNEMWQEICDAVNVAGNKQRFIHHCKKRFHDIKRQLRTKITREKSLLGDRAGPSAFQVYYTQYEEALKKVLPAEVIDGIEFFDSDHPQELCPEEAGPSWYTPENSQTLPMKKRSSRGLQKVSEPEGLQRPLYISFLDEPWSMLPDLSPTFPVEPSTVASMTLSTNHLELQPGCPVDPRKLKRHPSRCSIVQPHNLPNPTGNHGTHLLKVLKTTQKLFRKSMMHSLNVLHSDVGHFNKYIEESNSIADNLLRVEGERNSILHQMNSQLGKLTESLEQVANQQQAEQMLRHDFPRRRRRGRNGRSHQAGEVHRSSKNTSSAMACLSEPAFIPDTGQNNVL